MTTQAEKPIAGDAQHAEAEHQRPPFVLDSVSGGVPNAGLPDSVSDGIPVPGIIGGIGEQKAVA